MILLLPNQFIAAADTQQIYIVVGFLVGLIFFFAIGSRVSTPSSTTGSGKVSLGSFRRQAKQAGLEKSQIKILEKAAKNQNIANPAKLLTHGGLLNKVIKNLIEEVKNSPYDDKQKELLISEFFAIKRTISDKQRISKGPSSTIINQGQIVTLYTKNNPPFETQITGNMESRLAVELPKTSQGLPVRFKPGEPVKIRFLRDTGKVFRFTTKILEITHVEKIDVLLLDHVKEMEQIQLRKYRRKEFNKPAYFQKVEIVTEGTGKKAVRKAVVQKNRRFLGQIEDISAGGCALFSKTLLQKGNLIKISFDIQKGETINVFGKILHARPGKPYGGVMHVAFTRVSKKHLNQIQSFVYEIAGPEFD